MMHGMTQAHRINLVGIGSQCCFDIALHSASASGLMEVMQYRSSAHLSTSRRCIDEFGPPPQQNRVVPGNTMPLFYGIPEQSVHVALSWRV